LLPTPATRRFFPSHAALALDAKNVYRLTRGTGIGTSDGAVMRVAK
jgi:hypothetical protein